tara:strand:- start:7288 stop:7494 length:207 start_codon:yes stop_codon:yes gene_type:complete
MNTKIQATTIKKVTDALLKIQTDYPEVYKLLDEDPITLISDTEQNHTEALLEKYVNDLNALLDGFKKK